MNNKRIKELAEQAQEYVDRSNAKNLRKVFEKKFAELIVGECLDSISAHRAEAVDFNLTLDESFSLLINDIKNTFGVK